MTAWRAIGTAALLALLTPACGGDDAPTAERAPAATSVTTTAPPTTLGASTTTTTTTLPPTTLPPTTPPTTSTTLPVTTLPPSTLPVELPQPVAPPPEDGTTEPVVELGTIEIPAIGLQRTMQEGIRLSTLDRGPGHWPGTALPGDVGNVVVAGHRVSHNEDFRHLDQLVPGDEVVFTTAAGRSTYHVVSTEIVGPEALWIVDQTSDRTGTLFACHPPGSTRQRIVVHLTLA